MKKLLGILLVFAALSAQAAPSIRGLHCGTRGTLLGTIASEFVIPDYFPPEHFLVRMFLAPFIDLSMCDDGGPAHLGEACMNHDQCYGTLGATKDGCDQDMIMGWRDACTERYGSDDLEISSMCLDLCTGAVDMMYDIFRYDDGIFCPSCIAFEKSQSNARDRAR
jgi:hypothetical protein